MWDSKNERWHDHANHHREAHWLSEVRQDAYSQSSHHHLTSHEPNKFHHHALPGLHIHNGELEHAHGYHHGKAHADLIGRHHLYHSRGEAHAEHLGHHHHEEVPARHHHSVVHHGELHHHPLEVHHSKENGGARPAADPSIASHPIPVPAAGKESGDVAQPRVSALGERIAQTVIHNEGADKNGFNTFTRNDNGAGVAVGLRQWNQKKGELPELMANWHNADPRKFEELFGNHNPENHKQFEQWVRHANFASGHGEHAMRQALDTPEFQKVQENMMTSWADKQARIGKAYGLTARETATMADLKNQLGEVKGQRALEIAIHSPTDASLRMNQLRHGFADRFREILRRFEAD